MTADRPNRAATVRSTERAAALLVTLDDELVTAVREINDQVGTMSYELEDADPGWDQIGERAGLLVLMPSPLLARGAAGTTRSLLVTRNLDDAQVWRRAVHWNARHVVVLPDGANFLGGYLARHLAD